MKPAIVAGDGSEVGDPFPIRSVASPNGQWGPIADIRSEVGPTNSKRRAAVVFRIMTLVDLGRPLKKDDKLLGSVQTSSCKGVEIHASCGARDGS